MATPVQIRAIISLSEEALSRVPDAQNAVRAARDQLAAFDAARR